MVKLNKITRGLKPRIYAKLEYMNPGGSIKDRVGLAMVIDAERKGILKPGGTIVEPTSGNTGVGLALAAVLRGYKIIFTVPEKMSRDKIALLEAFGAKVIVTPSNVPPDHPAGYIRVAERIARTEGAFMPNQYDNESNPRAHYLTTGPEIWEQTNGSVTALVAGVGTGGTISGTGRYLKEKKPSLQVIGADPEGSILASRFRGKSGTARPYKVEGIGEDFIPETLDFSVIDRIVTVPDRDAFLITRRLAREEGILAGGSAGAAVFAAMKAASKMKKNDTIVVIIPDTGRSYLNKLYDDQWMAEYGFLGTRERRIAVSAVLRSKGKEKPKLIHVGPSATLARAVALMDAHGISQLPVLKDGVQVGSIRESSVMDLLVKKKVSSSSLVKEWMEPPLPVVRKDDKILDPFTVMKDRNAAIVVEGSRAVGIITVSDVVSYLAR
jgi:cystathionine beta-synthase